MPEGQLNETEHKLLRDQPVKLHPLEEDYVEKDIVFSGFVIDMPDGKKKFLQVNHKVSGLVFGLWRRQLKAKPFTVRGTLTFKADMDTYKEYDR